MDESDLVPAASDDVVSIFWAEKLEYKSAQAVWADELRGRNVCDAKRACRV